MAREKKRPAQAPAPPLVTRELREPVVAELRALQRKRSCAIADRIMIANRLVSTLAVSLGYDACNEASREERFAAAEALVASVREKMEAGEDDDRPQAAHARLLLHTVVGLEKEQAGLDLYMLKLVRRLPAVEWVNAPDQRGFGELQLAVIVGEAGDLANFPGPYSLFKYFGLAPFEHGGKTQMGSTWRRGGLSAERWTEFGYSPRRRSIAYLVGESLLKGNQSGPYRAHYDAVKARVMASGDPRTVCPTCAGAGAVARATGAGTRNCPKCDGGGTLAGWANSHAKLLMTKMLFKRLWCAWNGKAVL